MAYFKRLLKVIFLTTQSRVRVSSVRYLELRLIYKKTSPLGRAEVIVLGGSKAERDKAILQPNPQRHCIGSSGIKILSYSLFELFKSGFHISAINLEVFEFQMMQMTS